MIMIKEELGSPINESKYRLPKTSNFNISKLWTNIIQGRNNKFLVDDMDLNVDEESEQDRDSIKCLLKSSQQLVQ